MACNKIDRTIDRKIPLPSIYLSLFLSSIHRNATASFFLVAGSSGSAGYTVGNARSPVQQIEQQEPATARGRGGGQRVPPVEEEPAEQRQLAPTLRRERRRRRRGRRRRRRRGWWRRRRRRRMHDDGSESETGGYEQRRKHERWLRESAGHVVRVDRAPIRRRPVLPGDGERPTGRRSSPSSEQPAR